MKLDFYTGIGSQYAYVQNEHRSEKIFGLIWQRNGSSQVCDNNLSVSPTAIAQYRLAAIVHLPPPTVETSKTL